MAILETIRVKHPDLPDGVTINASDFDPLVHEPFDAEEASKPTGIAGVNVNEARDLVDLAETAEDLDVLEADENARDKGAREGVLKAIARKREVIAEAEKP